MLVVSRDEAVLHANERALRMFGYPSDDLIGLPVEALFPTSRRELLDPPAPGRPEATGEHRTGRVQGRRLDGSSFPLDSTAERVSIRGEDLTLVLLRAPHASASVDQDFSRIVAREDDDALRAIVNSTTAVIYVKDVGGRYLLVNRRFEDLFQLKGEELIGRTDSDFLSEEIARVVVDNDQLVVRAGQPIEFEELVPSGGEDRTYISIKFPLRRDTGEIYAVCGISTDITPRKRVEAELEASRRSLEREVIVRSAELQESNEELQREVAGHKETAAQLQRLIDTAHEGIWSIDASGTTTFVNPRMGAILGYSPEEMAGHSFYDFMSDARREAAAANLERCRRGISEVHEFELLRKDGVPVWVLLSTNPIPDGNGKIVGALAMATDISQRKHDEQHQLLLLQELDHRVKNTLAMVLALSDLTKEHAVTVDEFSSAFRGRIQAVARTHEALATARWKDVSFDEVAKRVLDPLSAGEVKRIRMVGDTIEISPNLITPLALTLNELGTNALKHGALSDRSGAVLLEWKRTGDDRFLLTWKESGGPPVASPSREGTGLQLVRGLIEYELGGKLDVEFSPAGLRYRVDIPVALSG